MSRKAVIDIGTNSIKFYVADAEPGSIATVCEDLEIARLGEGLKETGEISDKAAARNVAAIKRFTEKASELGADDVIAVGTMALRHAGNTPRFLAQVRDACGVDIEVLPGEEEARLSYLAALSGLDDSAGTNVVFDSGGGSTEFVIGAGRQIAHQLSLTVGAVVITDEFLSADPAGEDAVSVARDAIRKRLNRDELDTVADHLVGIGGTITTMAAVKHRMVNYDPDVIRGTVLTAGDVSDQIRLYSSMPLEQRKEIPGLQPKRADIILGGACIVSTILETFSTEQVVVSDRGLRHGLVCDRFGTSAP